MSSWQTVATCVGCALFAWIIGANLFCWWKKL